VAAAVDEFIEAAHAGQALNRSGRPYRPSALRDLQGILEYHVATELGNVRLRDVRRHHVQALVDRLGTEGLSESRIRSVVSALRGLYGYAIDHGHVEFNPADALVMPRPDQPAREGLRRDSLEQLWEDPPRWEDRPPRADPGRSTAGDHSDTGPRRRDRDRGAYQPIALLPQRTLSYAMRAVVLLFALVALVSLLESL
jgi:site-specific recombinase XerD